MIDRFTDTTDFDIDRQVQNELVELLFAGAVRPNIAISGAAIVTVFSLKSVIPLKPLAICNRFLVQLSDLINEKQSKMEC